MAEPSGPSVTAQRVAAVTQEDKQSRLARLGIATDGVTYIGLDLSQGRLADALVETGFEPDAPALTLVEGVVHYLDADTLRGVLSELSSLAARGSRLAISFGRPGATPAERARFEAAVSAFGEPAVGSVTADDSGVVLAECRWRAMELNERAKAAGFVMAAPADPLTQVRRLDREIQAMSVT